MRTSTLCCACTDHLKRNDPNLDPRRHHRADDMYFCPSCQNVRCDFCTVRVIASKFCSSCLNDYSASTESNCVKNCFTCPQCRSMLAISVSDGKKGGLVGKKFSFNCVCCQYNYTSDVIVKPKSILSIIRGEHLQHASSAADFDFVKESYSAIMNFELVSNKLIKDIKRGQKFQGMQLAPETIARLRSMNVGESTNLFMSDYDKLRLKLDEMKPVSVDEKEETELCSKRKLCTTLPQHGLQDICVDVFNSFTQTGGTRFPMPKRLTPRYLIKCIHCNHTLVEPPEELLSTRFSVKWNANELVPEVTISPRVNEQLPTTLITNAPYHFLVNIINPLSTSIKVMLATPTIIEIDGVTVESTIPVSKFKVGPFNPKDHIIKGIPTAYLTKETKVSRAELIMRLGRISTQKDTSVDEAEFRIEKSDNWCSVPIEVVVKADKPTQLDLKIPIFLSLQTQLPHGIRDLGLSKPDLSYGVWAIGLLNRFKIEPPTVDQLE